VDDERVRERLRTRDPVGDERHDGRGLEHANRGGRRRKEVRQPGRDDDEDACLRPQPEIESEHDEPEREAEDDPREQRPGEADEPDTRAP
jgi:hypothetical protein